MTSAQAIAVLIIRLWALEKSVASGFSLKINWDVYMSDRTAETYSAVLPSLSYNGLFIVVAVLVFLFANQAVALLLPKPAEKDEQFVFGVDDMVQAGSFLMGLFLLARFGPQTIYSLMIGLTHSVHEDMPIYMGLSAGYLSFLANIFLLIFALWLAIRPGHVARLFSWLRTAGLPRAAQEGQKAE